MKNKSTSAQTNSLGSAQARRTDLTSGAAAESTALATGLAALPWVLGAAGLGYLAYRYYLSVSIAPQGRLHASVKRRLPVSKSLRTISDEHGNYDIDGVSFDEEGVIVSGDNNKSVTAPI